MNIAKRFVRRVVNRIVNRPSEVQKRWYLKLLEAVEPYRAPEGERVKREKPVLIISGITMHGTGIFCNLLAFLRWVYFAELMGYTPVIDMQYVPNLYLEEEQIGKVNSYDYFYRQPAGMTAEEAYKSRDVFIVNRLDCPYNFSLRQKLAYKKATAVNDWVYGENRAKHFALYKRLYDTYFVPSDEAGAFVDARWNELVKPGERTLGLLCRGTDYFAKHPYRHQIQPTAEMIIEKTDALLAEHPVDKIFVATEDEDILAKLCAHYAEKVVYIDCPRLTAKEGQSVAEGFAEQKVDKKLNGLYYFASIACLSRCDHLIAGKTMATQFIRTMRDTDFETEFYWNLGRYGIDDKK